MDFALNLTKITLRLAAQDAISLPEYKGSALRGGFGHAFRKVVCAVRKKVCDDCLLRQRCAYFYIFETPPPDGTEMMRKYPRAPHPFVIEPPDDEKRLYEPGERLEFSLVLIGKGREYLPYFIYAFEELGRMGIGKGRGRYCIENVSSRGEIIYAAETKTLCDPPQVVISSDNGPVEKITLTFLTPTRIKYEEQLAPIPEFHMLIRSLLRRLSSLSYFHDGRRMETDFKGLIERAGAVRTMHKDLKWIDLPRYSARQQTTMMLGGFVGRMTFDGKLTEFMPYLRLGEIVHIGKATSFGLGKYVITQPTLPPHS